MVDAVRLRRREQMRQELMSPLRKAAGPAKVPVAVELVIDALVEAAEAHLGADDRQERPLLGFPS